MTAEQIITIAINGLINLTVLFFIIRSNTVVKERLKSQDDINLKMKSFMDIFSVDELKKYVEVRNESMKLKLENHIEIEKRKFAKNSEQYIRNIVDKDLEEGVENFKDKYNEAWNGLFDLIVLLPEESRIQFVKENFPFNSESFIAELKDYKDEISI